MGAKRDGRLDAHTFERVSQTPEHDAHAVFPPGVVDDVGHAIGRIGRDAGPDGGIVVPDLHVGRDPDRERLVVGPRLWLALEDEGILVAIGAAHRTERLGMRDARQARRQQPGGSGERETFSDELSAILIEHGAFSRSFVVACSGQVPVVIGTRRASSSDRGHDSEVVVWSKADAAV